MNKTGLIQALEEVRQAYYKDYGEVAELLIKAMRTNDKKAIVWLKKSKKRIDKDISRINKKILYLKTAEWSLN